MAMLGPNADLIGQPDSRARLCTPALLIDLDLLERNLGAMAAFCERHGVTLRPHAKTHKSVEIARRQLEAGAVGIACATIGEAERLIAGGIPNLLITSPLSTPAKLARLGVLLERAEGLTVVIDNLDAVDGLAHAAAETGKLLGVMVDLGVGLRRTGCNDLDAAETIARRVAASNSLAFAGIQAYSGHLQHVAEYAERERLARSDTEMALALRDRLAAHGQDVPCISGAGTGTHAIDAQGGRFSELQCGSYIFTDVDYNRVTLRPDEPRPFGPALFVRTSVISANAQDHVTTDAGLKHFATDGPEPEILRGAPPEAVYRFFGDEHGRVELADAPKHLPVGTALEVLTPHCDPTVNLHDVYHVVHGDVLVDIWPIDARGAI